jgi:hypothetical protein
MEELYAEGVAIHGGPESCAGAREGAGEALTGARVGRAIEPRNHQFGVPTPSPWWKATRPVALCESLAGPARSKNHGMHRTSKRENREIPRPVRRVIAGGGRSGNAAAVSLR